MGLHDNLKWGTQKPLSKNYSRSTKTENNERGGAIRSPRAVPSCAEGTWRSRAALLSMISDTGSPLNLTDFPDDCEFRLGLLCFNGIAVELRDLFRILEGLQHLARADKLTMKHISTFYEWFEGFFGIVMCIFDTEEDVLFSWIEKVAALAVENSLAAKRRKTKKERTKDLCWDILELKMQFENTADGKVSLGNLIREMKDEVEQLGSRILMYVQTVVEELPDLLNQNFGFDERRVIEAAVIQNFRATQQGAFVICAYSRGIVDPDKRNGFLEESFRTGKSPKHTVHRHLRKFRASHIDLANKLAINKLVIEKAFSVSDASFGDGSNV